MRIQNAVWLASVGLAVLLPGAAMASPRFEGNWITHLACEAHGETPAYKWEFPSVIKDNNFHGQHGEADGPGTW